MGILSLKHATCPTGHAEVHSWGGAYHIPQISGALEFVPLKVYNVLYDLALESTPPAKLFPAALFGVVYLNLLSRALLNLG